VGFGSAVPSLDTAVQISVAVTLNAPVDGASKMKPQSGLVPVPAAFMYDVLFVLPVGPHRPTP
jgi:hypothetical protein